MKSMKKAVLALVTVCVSVFLLFLCASNVSAAGITATGECGDNLTWVLHDDGLLVIEGTGDMWDWKYQAVPWYSYCDSITGVSISGSITSIGSHAFDNCTALTTLSIPDSVTEIGSAAFYRCTGLVNVDIPDSVVSIGSSAFYCCVKLANLILPSSITIIETDTFELCNSLISITLPDSITEIGMAAFVDCQSLTNVIIPDSVAYIDGFAFSFCPNLTGVTVLSPDVKYGSPDVFYGSNAKFTLYGYHGSTTEAYAAENGLNFAAIEEDFLPGDIDGNGEVNVADSIRLFRYTMMPDLYSISYLGSIDFTKDGCIDVGDAILLFRYSIMPDVYPLG